MESFFRNGINNHVESGRNITITTVDGLSYRVFHVRQETNELINIEDENGKEVIIFKNHIISIKFL